ncbi:hypothetical protein B0H13DRAFT_2325590 [Mycena leptocephala]|nr:hypothetical protein B0H13DRAFT_2325590 [Mycena leptocephala]
MPQLIRHSHAAAFSRLAFEHTLYRNSVSSSCGIDLSLLGGGLGWGFAKRVYRMFPSSSKEEDLEHNMNAALDAVPLKSMRKFARRSDRFIDAYRKGLDGVQAVAVHHHFQYLT